jgi:ATP-dependent DNA helicase RecG
MEVYSPGRLPGHVTIENLQVERFSRNEVVVAVLSDLGYIERLGYGIDRMYSTLRESGLPDPVFEETAAGFKVTLRAVTKSANIASLSHGPAAFNERQEMALEYVRNQGRITNSDLQELASEVSAETIRRDLADLVERNMLIRIGTKRATYYILK